MYFNRIFFKNLIDFCFIVYLFSGPCPPCPKMVKSQCFCKKSPSKTVRCSKKERSCGGICGRKLKCDKHSCPEICHSGDCPPCKEQSLVACQCRLNKKLTDCAQYSWQCDKVTHLHYFYYSNDTFINS